MEYEKKIYDELEDFVDNELGDGVSFEDLLDEFDVTPGQAFVTLFKAGLIDEDVLNAYLLNIK